MKLKLSIGLILLCIVVQAQQPKPALLKKGEVISDFTIMLDNGEKANILGIVSKSKYTLIDFWASWCKPCRQQFPKLKSLYEKFKNKGFNIIGVSIDANDSDWKKALSEDKTPWLHGRDVDKMAAEKIGVKAVPLYLLVDNEGKLVFATMFSGAQLETTLQDLLRE